MTLILDAPRPGAGPHLAGVATRVVSAGGPVLAGAGGALVYWVLTVTSRVACWAAAVVCVAGVHTEPSVPAQAGDVDACGAVVGTVRPGLLWTVASGLGRQMGWGRGYPAAGRPPRRKRWARRSRGRSSCRGTRSGTGCRSASICHHSYRARSRTTARGSGGRANLVQVPAHLLPLGPSCWAARNTQLPETLVRQWARPHPTEVEAEVPRLPAAASGPVAIGPPAASLEEGSPEVNSSVGLFSN